MQGLISVIVPVYKVEKYLNRCVDSVLNQTYEEFELILVDDESPDRCPQICDEYAAMDSRIKVIHQENKGPSSARNAGLDKMRGEYVSFLDSDDFIEKTSFENWIGFIQKFKADMVIGGYALYYGGNMKPDFIQKEAVVSKPEDIIKKILAEDDIISVAWGKLYKSNLFENLRFPENLRFAEDMSISYKLLNRTRTIIYDPSCYYNYSQEGQSLVRSDYNAEKLNRIKTAREWVEFINENYPDLESVGETYLMTLIVNECTNFLEEGNPEVQKLLLDYSEEIKKGYKKYVKNNNVRKNDKLKACLLAHKMFRFYKLLRKMFL